MISGCGDSTGPDIPLVWSAVASGTNVELDAVWGSSSSDVWAFGIGIILHWNGATWSNVTPPIMGGGSPLHAWGSSASDIWAVGSDTSGTAQILHYNGTSWSSVASPTPFQLIGVWGSSASDVWAVSYGGTIIHYNGTSWSTVPSGTTVGLFDVWGSSKSDVWAAGSGTLLHYDGVSWTRSTGMSGVYAVGGTSRSDVWAIEDCYIAGCADNVANNVLLHYDGAVWSRISSAGVFPDGVYQIWGSSRSNAWMVGENYSHTTGRISHYDGTTWSDVPIQMQGGFLYDVSGTSATDVWAVGDAGTILHGAPTR
jgi:hypothetical protein